MGSQHGRKPPNPQKAPKSHGKKPPKPPAHSNSGTVGTSGRGFVWLAVGLMGIPATGLGAIVSYFITHWGQ